MGVDAEDTVGYLIRGRYVRLLLCLEIVLGDMHLLMVFLDLSARAEIKSRLAFIL